MTARRSFALVFLALFLTTAFTSRVQSQPIWVVPESDHRILLEWLKPGFDTTDNTTFWTSTWFFSASVVASDNVKFVAEVPYTNLGIEGSDEGANSIGNIYLGVELHGSESPVFFEAGLRLPTTDKGGDGLGGALTDFVDRAEAFAPETLPVSGYLNFLHSDEGGLVVRIRGGTAVWFPRDAGDAEVFLVYGGQVGYAGEQVHLLAGLTGRWNVTSEEAGFGEASFHQLAVAVDVPLGTFQPGVSFRVPIDDDLGDIIDWVVGLSVAVNIPR